MSVSDKMRKCLIRNFHLREHYVYAHELVPEQQSNKVNGTGILSIPPLVMLHMLFVLNHHRLGDAVRSKESLQDLHTLMLYDKGTHVPITLRDISWQILGICQKTCGDYVGSLHSFQCSLQQQSFNHIKKATALRILMVLGRLLKRY